MPSNTTQDRSNLAALIRKLTALGELVFKLVTSIRSEITSLRSQISWNSFSVSTVSDLVTQVKSEVSALRSQVSFNTPDDLQIHLVSQIFGS